MLNVKSLIIALGLVSFVVFLPKPIYGANSNELAQNFYQIDRLSPSGAAKFVYVPQKDVISKQTLFLASIRDQLEAIRVRFQEILKILSR